MTLVWPLGVRLIHWAVAVACLFNFWILEEGETPHHFLGHAAAGVVLVLLARGLFSSRVEIKLKSLWRASPAAPAELRRLLSRQPLPLTRGHSPLASPVMLALWGLVLALGITGWMLGFDALFLVPKCSGKHMSFAHKRSSF